jgi:hypothetical protein
MVIAQGGPVYALMLALITRHTLLIALLERGAPCSPSSSP